MKPIPASGYDFRAYADEWVEHKAKYAYVFVSVYNTRAEMQADIDTNNFGPAAGCAGQVTGVVHHDKHGKRTGRIAYMWLNMEDLRDNGAEIVAHECVHAAMRYVQKKNVDLSKMPGEEVLAYTTGALTRQINNRLHKLGVF